MFSSVLIAVALAGAASAFTPPGFRPSATGNLTVAFGSILAVDGVDVPKADTQTAPTVGTAEMLFGSYSLIMVDPDIPPTNPGEPTGQLLHWMQTSLVSANTKSMVAGQEVYELINPTNTSAIATYIAPQPPARSPFSHRYTQLLVNTTGNVAALAVLASAGATRRPFSAQDVVTSANLTVLVGNWFNVTNTSTTAVSASGTGSGNVPTITPFEGKAVLGRYVGQGAAFAGFGFFVAVIVLF